MSLHRIAVSLLPAAVALTATVGLVIAAPVPTRESSSRGAQSSASTPTPGSGSTATPASASSSNRCRHQRAQEFLIRSTYMNHTGANAEQRRRNREAHERAIRYRTEHYGYFEGFGRREWNAHPPRYYAQSTTFFGVTVRMHRRVIPALQCVEQELQRVCARNNYRPRHLAGIRMENTYHTGEVTNHAYGIAIDVDPTRNTCCGCVGRWAEHPLCRRPSRTVWDRMAMPECWVQVFERYGFYWLGHDPMRDTMHFEFLGDPDRILR